MQSDKKISKNLMHIWKNYNVTRYSQGLNILDIIDIFTEKKTIVV